MRKIEQILWDNGVPKSVLKPTVDALLAEWPELGNLCIERFHDRTIFYKQHNYSPSSDPLCWNCGAKRSDV